MYIITDYRAFDCLGMTYFLSIYEGNDAAASSFFMPLLVDCLGMTYFLSIYEG